MSKPNSEYLKRIIDKEGWDYGWTEYSNYVEVEDKHFHKLRLAYLKASEALEEYVGFRDV